MDNYSIAIIITTFLRDNLLYKTLQTIVDNYTKDCIVLIADQGYASAEKDITIDYYKSQIALEYYKIPFDSGLSFARNYLVCIANEKKIPYVIISADSIQFIQKYNFQPVIDFLESNEKIGKIGFDLLGSKCPWEYFLEVTPNGIKFSYSNEWIEVNGRKYLRIDICRNIFLATTKSLINIPYDNDLKLGEHEDHAVRYKEKYLTYWTNYYSFKRESPHSSIEYDSYRKRLGDYLKIVKQKLGIKGWVIYPKNKKCI